MVARHVSHAGRCDHIIVMERGENAEQGTHESLMALNNAYAPLSAKDEERLSKQSD